MGQPPALPCAHLFKRATKLQIRLALGSACPPRTFPNINFINWLYPYPALPPSPLLLPPALVGLQQQNWISAAATTPHGAEQVKCAIHHPCQWELEGNLRQKKHLDFSSRQKEWLNNKIDLPAQEEMEESPDTQQTANAESEGNFRGNDPELELMSFNSFDFLFFLISSLVYSCLNCSMGKCNPEIVPKVIFPKLLFKLSTV